MYEVSIKNPCNPYILNIYSDDSHLHSLPVNGTTLIAYTYQYVATLLYSLSKSTLPYSIIETCSLRVIKRNGDLNHCIQMQIPLPFHDCLNNRVYKFIPD